MQCLGIEKGLQAGSQSLQSLIKMQLQEDNVPRKGAQAAMLLPALGMHPVQGGSQDSFGAHHQSQVLPAIL